MGTQQKIDRTAIFKDHHGRQTIDLMREAGLEFSGGVDRTEMHVFQLEGQVRQDRRDGCVKLTERHVEYELKYD